MINEKGVGHKVDVDVFKVTDKVLKNLDALEGHPNWYRREQIYIDLKGQKVLAWIYFNLRETATGKQHHERYIQKQYTNRFTPYTYKLGDVGSQLFERDYSFDDFKDKEFDVENETPMCVACYNDLQFDGFTHYHCQQCNAWYSENDVLTKF